MRKMFGLMFIFLLAFVFIIGCGKKMSVSREMNSQDMEHGFFDNGVMAKTEKNVAGSYVTKFGANLDRPVSKGDLTAESDEYEDENENNQPDVNVPQTQKKIKRQIIYTADYRIHVDDFLDAISKLRLIIKDHDGFIGLETNTRVIARIPAARFDSFLMELEDVGNVLEWSKKAEDVTDKFFDIVLRIRVKKVNMKALQELLKKAKNVIENLAIQKEINRLVEEIESLENRLNNLKKSIADSTITINLTSDTRVYKPKHRYNVPFQWVKEISIERLLGGSFYNKD